VNGFGNDGEEARLSSASAAIGHQADRHWWPGNS
jgi:hypothetical protein